MFPDDVRLISFESHFDVCLERLNLFLGKYLFTAWIQTRNLLNAH